ncbi:uncharacterized protein [Mytilus edulis]|uniref:uncharacterized protein n=1 Tax=Mytilus edulis TaxID=6550 RepID=UPI0039EFB3A8
MAYSQPTDEAQTPAVCQFCEESTDLRWKCINCDVFMCQLCITKIHKKIKSSDHHELINLKDFGTEDAARTIHKVDLKSMPCTIHSDQICCAFCTDCDQPVCLDCLIESHQNHKYRKLNEVYDTAISEMKDLQNKLESCHQFYGNEKENLEKLLLHGDNNFQVLKDQILQTERKMTDTISNYAKELLHELESIWQPTETKINLELSDIHKNIEEIVNREERLKKTLLSPQASEIFSSRKTLDQTIRTKSVEPIKCTIGNTKFCSGNIFQTQNTRRTIFGDLYAIPDLQLVKSYQTDLRNILNIRNYGKNSAIIACLKEKKVQKVTFEEKNIKVEEEISIAVRSLARLNNDEILLSTGGSDLNVYSIDKQTKLFKSFLPLKSISVHVSQNDKIFVGLTECHPVTYPATKESVRRVVVLNEQRDIQHIYEYDNDNQRLFTRPKRIVSLHDSIYVIDIINDNKEGRVIRLDQGGQQSSIYSGCYMNSYQAKFYPSDITVTSSDIILVLDQTSKYMHVLNFAGEVITSKDLKTLGIEFPFSLDIDKDDILWIGCNTKKMDKQGKAKIFALKLIL